MSSPELKLGEVRELGDRGGAGLIRSKSLLTPEELSIATMRAGGASTVTIATIREIAETTVRSILNRPAVARTVLMLCGIIGSGLEDGIRDLNAAFEDAASEAYLIERTAMRELFDLGDDLVGVDNANAIRAKMGAVTTAQDILDRAGKRAPTRIIGVHGHSTIPPQSLAQVADTLAEMYGGKRRGDDATIDISLTEKT